MSEGRPLFDLIESLEAKQAGIDQAEKGKKRLLAFARKLAREVVDEKGTVTADDVQLRLHETGISIKALGNSAGALFKGEEWEWTGQRVKSERVHAHANELKVWRLKRAA
jgi:hypothetical protein